MRLIKTENFPPNGYKAITIWPVVFYKGEPMSDRTIYHERCHWYQQIALLVIPFYILYGLFYLYNLVKYVDAHTAYRNIPFERYAYDVEKYYETPRSKFEMCFGWIKYIY